ncbi:FAD-dependent oxidoreductase [Actinoplanes sp. NPDC051851]|uniref:FAD-binding oxidoreductase n=1 Tax=Actinoplanes sp. NPDC051851 TaxID=3154753 RepID=UPI0034348B0D
MSVVEGDPFSFLGSAAVNPAEIVRPTSVEEVQAAVRAAAASGTPLWTVSRGKNLGYGGAAPRVPGSTLLDLSGMDRILEVDDESGYCVVEPGVTFLALDEHLRATGSRLMPSVPDIGWGSVIGNALERGFGYTPHGDHSAYMCGLEVVLADGTLLRTGMGAFPDSSAWALYKGGYGPSLDGLFVQSNLGIVTKMGVWLMPRPETISVCQIGAPSDDDLAPLIDTLRPLLLDGTIQSNVVIGNAPVIASMVSPRAAWWTGAGPMPAAAVDRITAALGIGRWNARCAFYGPPALVAARLDVLRGAVSAFDLKVTTYPGDVDPADVHPADRAQLGIPSTDLIRMAEWRGGTPAHTDFSLVCPPTGRDAVRQKELIERKVEAHGFDYAGGFTLNPRHAIALALVSFDRDDPAEAAAVAALFPELIADAAAAGYAPYRAHVAYMDLIADRYDAYDSAHRHTVERIKDALDPAGVLSPGKQGVWPAGHRSTRGAVPR